MIDETNRFRVSGIFLAIYKALTRKPLLQAFLARKRGLGKPARRHLPM